ncbi:hypothetical protein [Nocardia cyriacigeorgica]|uniref:Uncharacterized protein n=1 Tax=Nocardia cyriacigeorgica TaxID=135487 RepID=A0A4V6IBU4_9NOCA|nr:hypothetical protein [Nocardia cyriacigeorgica]MBF6101479.1 hypothetical protein [Nocardia cyriacigeorgica]MBF6162124.1 hypothetical protein [Nocardia cyriacigeorgica]MBF6200814.1 hypothetical protein [Nocardia cyriacigeorgica]VFA97123.1 Uncharacterised protein [Nocardia cyriacigeorgica]
MSTIVFARIAAVPVSAWLIAQLTVDAGYRAGNIFAAPDLAFSTVLLIAALLPTRSAVPVLTAGFFFGSGVITVAALDRFHREQIGAGVLDLVIAAIYLTCAVLLSARALRRIEPAAG